MVFLRAQFKVDKSLTLIRIFLQCDVFSGVVDPAFAGGADGSVSQCLIIEGNGHMLICSVAGTSKTAEFELNIQVILPTEDDFGVDEMEYVLIVSDARPIVLPLDLIKGCIAPFFLAAGVDLSVAAGY